MSPFERLRERVGSTNRRRYTSGEYHLPDEVSDPHDREDATKPERFAWAKEHPGWAFLFLLGTAFALLVFGQQLMRFGVSIWENRLARLTGGAFVLGSAAYVGGRRQQQSTYESVDRLILKLPNGVKRYHGRFVENEEGDAPLFVPIKGWSWLGRPGAELAVGEVSYEIAQKYSQQNRDPDDAAVIRLHPGFAAVSQTAHGTVVGQLSNGLELDPFGQQSNLQATLPDRASEDALEELRDELESAREEIQHARDKTTQLRRQRDHFKAEAEKAREEHVEPVIETYQRIRAVERHTAGDALPEGEASVGGPVDVAGPTDNTGYDPDAIEEELSDDDDE